MLGWIKQEIISSSKEERMTINYALLKNLNRGDVELLGANFGQRKLLKGKT